MVAIISPSKDLDFKTRLHPRSYDTPRLWNQSLELVKLMKGKSPRSLKSLMSISDKLAIENSERYKQMTEEFTVENSKPAIFSFSGDVYRGLDVNSLKEDELQYTQKYLRILSGLYGLLRPMDIIQPYRLEMGLPLKVNSKVKNLYQFWTERVTQLLEDDIKATNSTHLINLSSEEYFHVIDKNKISVPILTVHFREYRNNKLSFLSFNAKKARGLMSRYLTQSNATNFSQIKNFNLENYTFDEKLSTEEELYFIR
ncbi:MAG: peroxide stress protein YaaA [Saprospiraceae bacterium]|nr:peroxide stress protein YaaA [Saprospiraceae bacterium]